VRLIRTFARLAIFAIAAWALYQFCYWPYECNKAVARADRRTMVAVNSSDAARAAISARTTIEQLEPCLDHCPTDMAIYMDLALNYEILSNPQKAIDIYKTALRYDRRPELFLNLGLALYRVGDPQAGLAALMEAIRVAPYMLDEIEDHDAYVAVQKAMGH
jgi:tetratricopeptide (TPR) repeat protein